MLLIGHEVFIKAMPTLGSAMAFFEADLTLAVEARLGVVGATTATIIATATSS
jgi:hypothetical protein